MPGLGSQSPNQREGLSAVSSITGNNEYVHSTNHALDVNANVTISGEPLPIVGATEAIVTAVVDGDGNQITSFGGGTQYQVGDAAGATDTGTLGLLVRDDALATLPDPDGDYTQGRTNSRGAQWVIHDGAISAAQSGTWNITNVSGTISLPTGASTEAAQTTGNASLATIAGAVSGTEMQVDVLTMPMVTVQATNLDIRDLTSASDSVAAVQSGAWTVTANAGTNLNTSALALESGGNLAAIAASVSVLDDWDESDRAKVNLIVGQAGITAGAGSVAANTPRVTHASDDPAVVALQLIDNIVPSINGPGAPTVDSYSNVSISTSANTADQQLVAAPGANKQIWVYGLVGSADTGDGSIALQDEDNTAITGVMEVTRRGGFVQSPSGNFAMPWVKVATNKALEMDTVTCGFKGVLSYAIVSV